MLLIMMLSSGFHQSVRNKRASYGVHNCPLRSSCMFLVLVMSLN
jgi:hypothetical protein